VLGCGLLPTAGVLAESAAFGAHTSLVPAVEQLTGPLCHHDPARTPQLAGRALPVCARCVGLYAGAAAGGLMGLLVPHRPSAVRGALRFALGTTLIGLLAALIEAAGLIATSNAARVGLGALLGAGVPLLGALGGSLILKIR
jgi:uncharacterized membrane protein